MAAAAAEAPGSQGSSLYTASTQVREWTFSAADLRESVPQRPPPRACVTPSVPPRACLTRSAPRGALPLPLLLQAPCGSGGGPIALRRTQLRLLGPPRSQRIP